MPIFTSRTRLRFEWDDFPDPPEVSFRLARMGGWFMNTEAFTEAAQEIAIRDMDQKFEEERDPEGIPWQELKQPSPFQVSILRLTTEMYEKAISPATWEATPHGIFFNTTNLPPYWIFHEQPQGTGRKQRIPRRSFIPLSADAQSQITVLFDQWAAEGMELGSRGFAREFRNPRGQFASFG